MANGSEETPKKLEEVKSNSFPALPFLDLEAQRERRKWRLASSVLVKKCEKLGEEAQETRFSDAKLRIVVRRRRVFDLACKGFNIEQIRQRIGEEGGGWWSYNTIYGDLHSDAAKERREELERQQLLDIALADDRKLRLEFRDRMIERLTPRRSPEVSVQIANQLKVEQSQRQTNNLLMKLSKEEKKVLLHAEEILTKAEKAAGYR